MVQGQGSVPGRGGVAMRMLTSSRVSTVFAVFLR